MWVLNLECTCLLCGYRCLLCGCMFTGVGRGVLLWVNVHCVCVCCVVMDDVWVGVYLGGGGVELEGVYLFAVWL